MLGGATDDVANGEVPPNGNDVQIEEETGLDLIYSIYDKPPWYLASILGFQV